MSQIKAGKFKLVLEQFNLCDILYETQQMMQPLAKNKQNQLIIQIDETLQNKIYSIRSDKYRIRQILINLISNSIKYTSNGNIYLVLTREKVDDRYFRIAVRDEGQGIKKEFRQKLFQAFGQEDDMESKTKNNPQGVGLGLMISNTIAKNLKPNGQIASNLTSNFPKNNGSLSQIRSQITPTQTQHSNRSLGQKVDIRDSKVQSNLLTTITPQFSPDEGLILNEDIEKGTEFYFLVYNFQQQDLKQLAENTQNSRNLSINLQIKRPSMFSLQENLATFEQSPLINKDNSNQIRQIAGHILLNSKKISLDAFDSEVNSSEEESQSCSSTESYQGIEKCKNNPQNIEKKDMVNQVKNLELQRPQNQSAENFLNKQDQGQQNKRPSERQLGLKKQFHTANQNIKKRIINSRKSISQDLESIIKKSSMRKRQYNTFNDTEIHILIIDDDQFSALALKSKIAFAFKIFNKNLALTFTTLYSGSECIKELQKRQKCYSFLFIDAQMPEMDGFDTIRQIDSLNFRNISFQPTNPQDIPIFNQMQIILCSGFQKEDTKLYIYRIKHYLQKPVEQTQLIQIIRQVFIENSLCLPSDDEDSPQIIKNPN